MPERRFSYAIALVVLATLAFTLMAAIVKTLATDLPVVQVVWGRYFFHFLLVLALFPHRTPTLLVSRRKGLQILRSVLVLLATLQAFTAITYLPLATVAALGFVAPVLVVTLAAFALRERVSIARWVAVGVGFAGVLIILRPGSPSMHWAMLLGVGMATCYALYQILTRVIRHAATALTSLFYTALVGALATSVAVLFNWREPSATQWAFMVANGLLGGIGHFSIIRAYESVDASRIAPFVYTELLWTTLIGWVLFSELPDNWTFVGATVIIGSGLYLIHSDAKSVG